MKYKLGSIFPGLTVQLFDNAEDLLQPDLSQTKVLIIDNDFGSGKMTGVEAVQLVRQQYGDDIAIALWSADDIGDSPGADFIWPKNVSKDVISVDLNKLVGRN